MVIFVILYHCPIYFNRMPIKGFYNRKYWKLKNNDGNWKVTWYAIIDLLYSLNYSRSCFWYRQNIWIWVSFLRKTFGFDIGDEDSFGFSITKHSFFIASNKIRKTKLYVYIDAFGVANKLITQRKINQQNGPTGLGTWLSLILYFKIYKVICKCTKTVGDFFLYFSLKKYYFI